MNRLIDKFLLENRGLRREGVGVFLQIQARSAGDQRTRGLACIYYALPERNSRQERLADFRGWISFVEAGKTALYCRPMQLSCVTRGCKSHP
jgi:hypothetical protein